MNYHAASCEVSMKGKELNPDASIEEFSRLKPEGENIAESGPNRTSMGLRRIRPEAAAGLLKTSSNFADTEKVLRLYVPYLAAIISHCSKTTIL
jgi:hypothetical protein